MADRFIFGVAPIDYSPVLLLMPFGFHLAMDTLPSGESLLRPTTHYCRLWIWRPSFERQRDFNPPEQRAAQRTLCQGPTPPQCSRSAYGAGPFRAVLSPFGGRYCGGLPVLVHVVSQRARGLRLRGVTVEARDRTPPGVLRSPRVHRVGTPKFHFSKLNTLPADASVYASTIASRRSLQNSRSGWFATPFL